MTDQLEKQNISRLTDKMILDSLQFDKIFQVVMSQNFPTGLIQPSIGDVRNLFTCTDRWQCKKNTKFEHIWLTNTHWNSGHNAVHRRIRNSPFLMQLAKTFLLELQKERERRQHSGNHRKGTRVIMVNFKVNNLKSAKLPLWDEQRYGRSEPDVTDNAKGQRL